MSIAKTKIDASFPSAEFALEGYHSPYRLDISNRSGGILVYVKSSIPTCRTSYGNLCREMQAVLFEINLRKEKWLVISIYHPPLRNSEIFLNSLTMMIDSFACSCDNFLIMGDFNMEPSDPFLTCFCDSNSIINLIKDNTYFKGIGSHIDLI